MRNKIGKEGKVAVTTIIAMVLLIVVVVIAYLIINYGPGFLEQIVNMIKGVSMDDSDGGGEVPISYDMVNAIKCSYYRCTNGCDSDEIKNIQIETLTGTKKCKEDFCVPFGGVDGEVCGDANPVEVILTEPSEIYREDIGFPAQCLGAKEDYTEVLGGDRRVVLVDKDDVREQIDPGSCIGLHSYGPDTNHRGLVLYAGVYYVWSWGSPGFMGTKCTSVTTRNPSS